MLWRQTIYFLCNCRNLAKFLARILVVWVSDGAASPVWLNRFLNRADDTRGIHLESAAQVLHMIYVT
jgi:hypothetical protein